MNLLQNLGASAGSCGNLARESRLQVLEQEILNTPREQLPDVITGAMNDFYGNKWDIIEFVHHLLWHANEDVHMALIAFSQSAITEEQHGAAFATEFRQLLAEGVTTFVFKTTHPAIHAELFKVVGLPVPSYRAGVAMMPGQSVAQARLASNAQVRSVMSPGQSVAQARQPSNAQVRGVMSPGQSVAQARRPPNQVLNAPRATFPASGQLSVGNVSGMALEVRGGGGGQMVRHEAQVDVVAMEQRVYDRLLHQMTPQLAKIGVVMNGVASRVGHLEEGHAMNASRMDQLEHSNAIAAERVQANHNELKNLIIANRGPAAPAPVPSYPAPPALSAFAMGSAASSPAYAGFMGIKKAASVQTAASSVGLGRGGPMFQNKTAASSFGLGRGGPVFQNKTTTSSFGLGRGGPMFQNKTAASSFGLGGGGSMGRVPPLVENFSELVETTATFLSDTKKALVQQTIAFNNFQENGPEFASVIALGVKFSHVQGAKEASQQLTVAISAMFPDFPGGWLPENASKFSTTLGVAQDAGVKRSLSDMAPAETGEEYMRIVRIPLNAFSRPVAEVSPDGAGGVGGESVDGVVGEEAGADTLAEEREAGDGGATETELQQRLAQAAAAGDAEFDGTM